MLTQVTAENLQVGDRISHLEQFWKVVSTPKLTRQGMQFDVICLISQQRQTVIFHPNWRLDLV